MAKQPRRKKSKTKAEKTRKLIRGAYNKTEANRKKRAKKRKSKGKGGY